MISLPDEIEYCLRRLSACAHAAYVVGGCVRDSLLGRAPEDWDLCTDAQPHETIAAFPGHKTILTGERHGTVTVLVDSHPVEITTFRTDGVYADHRRPEQVRFSRRLADDLARRDFTINAMAYHPDRGLVDICGGQDDLRAGIIRCVGDAHTRFNEDALRMLRLFRFSAQLGFAIDPEALAAAGACSGCLRHISGERISAELDKLLCGERPAGVLGQMSECGVLEAFIPEFAPCVGFDQHTPYHNRTVDLHTFAAVEAAPRVLEVRLALLLHDIAKPRCLRLDSAGVGHFKGHAGISADMSAEVLARLRYDRRTTRRVLNLIARHDGDIPADELYLKRALSRFGGEELGMMLEVRIADTAAKTPELVGKRLESLYRAREMLKNILAQRPPLTVRDLAVGGRELISLGFVPGKALGDALETLLSLVLEDASRNEPGYLLERAGELLAKGRAPTSTDE